MTRVRAWSSRLLFPVVLTAAFAATIVAQGRGVSASTILAVVSVVVIAVAATAERLMPFDVSWNRPRGDVRTDLIHGVVSNLALPEIYKRGLSVLFVPIGAGLAGRLGFGLWPH